MKKDTLDSELQVTVAQTWRRRGRWVDLKEKEKKYLPTGAELA